MHSFSRWFDGMTGWLDNLDAAADRNKAIETGLHNINPMDLQAGEVYLVLEKGPPALTQPQFVSQILA